MTQDNKTPLTTLCERLTRHVGVPIGRNHLAVLMHGWTKKHPEQAPDFHRLSMRKKNDGFAWLNPRELRFLSNYAGYDLTHD